MFDDLAWRTPELDDLAAWVQCLADSEAVDRTGEIETEAGLRPCFEGVGYDPADGWFGFAGDGSIAAWTWPVCFGEVGDSTRVSLDGGVHPAWRGRSIGARLLEVAQERGQAVLDRKAPTSDHPGWLEVQAYEHHATRIELFTANGFAPLRYFDELKRDLAAPIDDPTPPDGIRIEPFAARHDSATRAAHNAAFADHWGFSPWTEAEWATHATGGEGFRGDLSRLALGDDDEVLGYAINAVHPHEFEALGFSEGWIHLLGVAREHRGRGVATALLGASMQAMRAEGLEYASLGVDSASPTGAFRVYAAVGFERHQRFTIYAKAVTGRPGPR